MTNFKGFNTINQDKKFSLTDFELIKRDLLNAFTIREGSMPGRPDIGTSIWAYAFEPNDAETEAQINSEVTRIINDDPRIILNELTISAANNTIIVEVNITIKIDASIEQFALTFDEKSASVNIN